MNEQDFRNKTLPGPVTDDEVTRVMLDERIRLNDKGKLLGQSWEQHYADMVKAVREKFDIVRKHV